MCYGGIGMNAPAKAPPRGRCNFRWLRLVDLLSRNENTARTLLQSTEDAEWVALGRMMHRCLVGILRKKLKQQWHTVPAALIPDVPPLASSEVDEVVVDPMESLIFEQSSAMAELHAAEMAERKYIKRRWRLLHKRLSPLADAEASAATATGSRRSSGSCLADSTDTIPTWKRAASDSFQSSPIDGVKRRSSGAVTPELHSTVSTQESFTYRSVNLEMNGCTDEETDTVAMSSHSHHRLECSGRSDLTAPSLNTLPLERSCRVGKPSSSSACVLGKSIDGAYLSIEVDIPEAVSISDVQVEVYPTSVEVLWAEGPPSRQDRILTSIPLQCQVNPMTLEASMAGSILCIQLEVSPHTIPVERCCDEEASNTTLLLRVNSSPSVHRHDTCSGPREGSLTPMSAGTERTGSLKKLSKGEMAEELERGVRFQRLGYLRRSASPGTLPKREILFEVYAPEATGVRDFEITLLSTEVNVMLRGSLLVAKSLRSHHSIDVTTAKAKFQMWRGVLVVTALTIEQAESIPGSPRSMQTTKPHHLHKPLVPSPPQLFEAR